MTAKEMSGHVWLLYISLPINLWYEVVSIAIERCLEGWQTGAAAIDPFNNPFI